MILVAVILLALIALGGLLWVGQAYRMLRFAQVQMDEAWVELEVALEERREIVPYIVAAVPINISQALDVLGNACDLAANVEGIRDSSQAEARLSAAINRLLLQLDEDASIEVRELLAPLRERLISQDMKVGMLTESYNRQAEMFNALQQRAAARVLVSCGMVKPAELF